MVIIQYSVTHVLLYIQYMYYMLALTLKNLPSTLHISELYEIHIAFIVKSQYLLRLQLRYILIA